MVFGKNKLFRRGEYNMRIGVGGEFGVWVLVGFRCGVMWIGVRSVFLILDKWNLCIYKYSVNECVEF